MKSKQTSKMTFLLQIVSVLLCTTCLLSGCSGGITIDSLKDKINDNYGGFIGIGELGIKKNNEGYGFNYLQAHTGWTSAYWGQADDAKKVKSVNIMITKTNGEFDFSSVDSIEKACEKGNNNDFPAEYFVRSVSVLYKVLGGFNTVNSYSSNKEVEEDIFVNASKTMNRWSFRIETNDTNAIVEANYIG